MENSEVTMEGIKEGEVKELSKAELKARREEITNYYQDHIPHLVVQLEYEKLLTEIEEHRAKRAQAQKFIAQMMAPEVEKQGNLL